MAESGPVAVLDEILEPLTDAFSRDVAEALVRLTASPTAQQRISNLAEKCNDGTLTSPERAEYESYVNAIDLISVLQAKARIWLARHPAS